MDANLIKISQALLDEYACVCSVNVVNNEYQWYWIDPSLDAMLIEPAGTDFFKDIVGFVDRVVYEEDVAFFVGDGSSAHGELRVTYGCVS